MQDRSRGSKRFELGPHVERPTLANIYEEQTPAHWPPPTEAKARRTAAQPQRRAPRDGLIASQLGLPIQSRAPAHEPYAPENWQTQAAADGDWPLDSYTEPGAFAAYGGEYATYDEDAELQAALDLDNSQGLYDEQLGAYYAASTPALDLRLPPITRSQDQNYPAHDYAQYARAYAEPWAQTPVQAPHYTSQHSHAQPSPHATPTGTYPYARIARQSSQPSAAKWQTEQPIQRVASSSTTTPRVARAVKNVALHLNAPAATTRSAPAQRKRSFIDDEPVIYPESRGSGWLKAIAVAVCLAAAAYAARDFITPALKTQQPPAQPTPVASEVPPEPPAPTPEPMAAPVVEAAPGPQESAKARRSAARAALIAEHWRERRAARRGQSAAHADTTDQPDTDPTEPAQTSHYAPKAAAQPGSLRINSRPWSQIYIDGQPVGHTPQMNVQLSPGQHQVTLINNEMQLRKEISVSITPGATTTQTVNLAE